MTKNVTLKIMTANVAGYHAQRQDMQPWDMRSSVYSKILQEYSPDILCLQEFQINNLDFFINSFPYFNFFLSHSISTDLSVMYSPIFYLSDRLQLCNTETLSLPYNSNHMAKGLCGIPKTVACNFYDKLSKNHFCVVNTHLDSIDEQSRFQTCKKILHKIDSYKISVILTGDFNARPETLPDEDKLDLPPLIIKDALPQDTNLYNYLLQHDFQDSFTHSKRQYDRYCNTYHDNIGEQFPNVALRIDWIMLKNIGLNLKFIDYNIIKRHINNIYPSDHFLVMATLKFVGV